MASSLFALRAGGIIGKEVRDNKSSIQSGAVCSTSNNGHSPASDADAAATRAVSSASYHPIKFSHRTCRSWKSRIVQTHAVPRGAVQAAFGLLQFVESACVLLCAYTSVQHLLGAKSSSPLHQQAAIEPTLSRSTPLTKSGKRWWRWKQATSTEQRQVMVAEQQVPAAAIVRDIQHSYIALHAACFALFVGWLVRRLQQLLNSSGGGNSSSSTGVTGSVSLDGAARLSCLEALLQQQLADFAVASKQLEKLQLHTRLTASELRRPVDKVQQSSAQQAEVIARLAQECDKLRRRADDTEQLLMALQATSARQFKVTMDVLKQVRS